MPKMRFTDYPTPAPRTLYDEAVQGIINRNKGLSGLKSIVQFGNITTPGISDLDLLFVFKSGKACLATGLENLPAAHKNLFTHGIMAISEDQYADNEYYTIWSEHHLVWGENPSENELQRTTEEDTILKIQTAIEFLIANFIDIKIQKEYKIIKLRALLQHMKGILYDLDYLNDSQSVLHTPLMELKDMIKNWFIHTPSEKKLTDWFLTFEELYDKYVHQVLSEHPMYLPSRDTFPISKNMKLQNSATVNFERKGIMLPSILSTAGRNYVKLQHRFNQFTISCPITHDAPTIIKERFDFLVRMKQYNRQYLPNFMTITTSITAKLI
ncbi:MAG: hypothetical protein IPK10_11705 [Bacteroidetes bacterium]|nr:hypothetical protein [Bacteroidota bacterium]